MKKIKQLQFDITGSRRIRNYVDQRKLKEKIVLERMKNAVEIIYSAWKKNYAESEISFFEFFKAVMKYAEFAHRLEQRKDELKRIESHVEILQEAIEEYEEDYNYIRKLEKIVEAYERDKQ